MWSPSAVSAQAHCVPSHESAAGSHALHHPGRGGRTWRRAWNRAVADDRNTLHSQLEGLQGLELGPSSGKVRRPLGHCGRGQAGDAPYEHVTYGRRRVAVTVTEAMGQHVVLDAACDWWPLARSPSRR